MTARASVLPAAALFVAGEWALLLDGRRRAGSGDATRGAGAALATVAFRDGLGGLDVFEVTWTANAAAGEVAPEDLRARPGSAAELRFGRRGATERVLDGEVSALETERGPVGDRVLRVRGADRLVAIAGPARTLQHEARCLGELARAVAGSLGLAVRASDGPPFSAPLAQRGEPDAPFLRRVARGLGFDVALADRTLVVEPLPQPVSARPVLGADEGLAQLKWTSGGGADELECVAPGDARLRAGRLAELRAGGPEDGLYRLTSTVHRFGRDGYRVRLRGLRVETP
ncbi:MAG: hypothetical protein HYZ53_30995 [Planctomycetes bacterium]|nr:hypothetical protein [Planctomycetota bacterium]